MVIKLLIDPHSKRVVYAAYDSVVPERITIMDGCQQYLFSPATCEHALYAGVLPAGFGPQKCWNFRYSDDRIQPVSKEPPKNARVSAVIP